MTAAPQLEAWSNCARLNAQILKSRQFEEGRIVIVEGVNARDLMALFQ